MVFSLVYFLFPLPVTPALSPNHSKKLNDKSSVVYVRSTVPDNSTKQFGISS